jgi:alpha-tubulin suppressor-like RCC1 family protein
MKKQAITLIVGLMLLAVVGELTCSQPISAGSAPRAIKTGAVPSVRALGTYTAIAAGWFHTCALTAGGVKCWGANWDGQLGDGTTTGRTTPVDVSGLTSGVAAIATGSYHTCAVTTGGGVKCWGYNNYGQLGDGTTTDRNTPVDVSGLTSGVAAIAAGESHTCALTAGGGVKCWGRNSGGQLGDGTTTDRTTPVDVSGLTSGVAAIAAGGYHTCALTAGGGVKCWGRNSYGQLGDGTTTNRNTPVDVSGLTSGVNAIAAGSYHTCALTMDGGARCWGHNLYGQLGNGKSGYHTIPVDVSGLTSGVSAIAAGEEHTCALTAGGGAKCWGVNYYHQLGDGTTTRRNTPVDVSGLTSGVAAIAPSQYHTCALTTGGGVKCWGYNSYGQLGDGTTTGRATPVDVSGLTSGVAAIATGSYHTCAVTTGGGVKCWGYNRYGQLGDGTTTQHTTPGDVSGLTSGVTAIVAGEYHTCALTAGGGVKCWGGNGDGQLGDGTTTDRTTPVDVSGLTSGIAAIATSYHHTCALTTGSGAKCWGRNDSGQLGDGTTAQRTTPVDVSGLTSGVAAIAAGWYHTCALTAGGGARCWGDNWYGQLGDGTTTGRTTPVDVSGLTSGVAAIAAGGDHTCALTAGGGARCWGHNLYGQLGNGEFGYSPTPVEVSPAAHYLHLPLILK